MESEENMCRSYNHSQMRTPPTTNPAKMKPVSFGRSASPLLLSLHSVNSKWTSPQAKLLGLTKLLGIESYHPPIRLGNMFLI